MVRRKQFGWCDWSSCAYVRFAYEAINVSAALNRRGMRHESSIQSSGGWRQPTLFLPRADILYGLCRMHVQPSRASIEGIDDWRLTASFYYNASEERRRAPRCLPAGRMIPSNIRRDTLGTKDALPFRASSRSSSELRFSSSLLLPSFPSRCEEFPHTGDTKVVSGGG